MSIPLDNLIHLALPSACIDRLASQGDRGFAALGVVEVVCRAVECLEITGSCPDDPERRRASIDHARRHVACLGDCLSEGGGDVAFDLLRLYIFTNRRLADAIGGDPGGLVDGMQVLRHLRDEWVRELEERSL